LSIDVDATPATLAWLRGYAAQYGFVEDVPREPWHWTFQAGAAPVLVPLVSASRT
jgi:D-alanyl-D-alanine carboxypeptidase